MKIIQKTCLAWVSFLLLLSFLLHCGYLLQKKRTGRTHKVSKCCGRTCFLQTEPFIPVAQANILVVSAYWDSRNKPNIVRILAIVNRNRRYALKCTFCQSTSTTRYETQAKIYVHNDHFNFHWALADIICFPAYSKKRFVPDFVALQHNDYKYPMIPINNVRQSHQELSFTHDFGVCISALFGDYNNVLQFTQTVEMYRLLGAGRVTIYNSSCGPELNRVLSYYAATGMVEVIPWPINRYLTPSKGWLYPNHSGDVHYYGQTAALNDCLYRHMYDTRYLFLHDADEIVFPVDCADWHCLLRRLNRTYRADIYLLESHVFPYTITEDFGKRFNKWNAIPGHNVMAQVRREPNIQGIYNPTKMILNPRKVVWTSVHTVTRAYGNKVVVPMRIAKLHHYRRPEQPKLAREELIFDGRIWHYYSTLSENVNNVFYQTGFLT